MSVDSGSLVALPAWLETDEVAAAFGSSVDTMVAHFRKCHGDREASGLLRRIGQRLKVSSVRLKDLQPETYRAVQEFRMADKVSRGVRGLS